MKPNAARRYFICAAMGVTLAAGQQTKSVIPDVSYGKDSPSQTLDLYVPAKSGFATVIYTYGGGWHSGSGKSATPIAQTLQSLGYGCVLVSHRLSSPDSFPAQLEDVAAALAWTKRNIAAWGGNPEHIALAVHSSGAHLSLLLVTDPRFLAKHDLLVSDVAAVIGLSTPLDSVTSKRWSRLRRHAVGGRRCGRVPSRSNHDEKVRFRSSTPPCHERFSS
jgi:acetyl esterase/lipase